MPTLSKDEIQIILNALGSARSLILGEYESLQDDDLRVEYDEVLKQIDKAFDTLKNDK